MSNKSITRNDSQNSLVSDSTLNAKIDSLRDEILSLKKPSGAREIGDQDRLAIYLAEYKSQDDWQRHNETQRHAISGGLLALAALLISSYKPDSTPIWMPLSLTLIGVFGVVVICKYWERFCYHSDLAEAILKSTANLLPTVDGDLKRLSTHDAIIDARIRHYKSWSGSIFRLYPWFRDSKPPLGVKTKFFQRGIMQHWLWILLFGFVALLGIAILFTNLCNHRDSLALS